MSNTIDSERIAKDIIFLESDSSRGNWDVEEWEAKILSRYPVLQERVATAAGWIQVLIVEAVAAERQACEAIAEKWCKTWDDLAHEFQGKDVSMARNAVLRASAAWRIQSDIRARAGEGEQATT